MPDDVVAALRCFNRSFTPRIGVLDESFLGTGRPLAAARLLFEIGGGPDAPAVHDLRRRLGVDSGYLSRLLRNLERDELIELVGDPADRRRRTAQLTPEGQKAWQVLDDRSTGIAVQLVEPLTTDQRAELARALDTADRLLRVASISFEIVDPAGPLAEVAVGRYFGELDRRFPDGFDATDDSTADRRAMAAPSGGFLVGDDRGDPVACGGVHRWDDVTAEIKRMWLDPSLRGLGVGKQLLARLEALAAELGYRSVLLDTNSSLTEAITLYERAGYRSVERYNDNPYAERWFRKEL